MSLIPLQLRDTGNSFTAQVKMEQNQAYAQVLKIKPSKNDAYGAVTFNLIDSEPHYSSVGQI